MFSTINKKPQQRPLPPFRSLPRKTKTKTQLCSLKSLIPILQYLTKEKDNTAITNTGHWVETDGEDL